MSRRAALRQARQPPPCIVLPEHLDAAAAAALIELLNDAARLLEAHYAAQLERLRHPTDTRQGLLFGDEPPF